MVDDSQQQAAQGASLPPEKAAHEDSPSSKTSDDLSNLISDETQELTQQAANRESPTQESEEIPEGPSAQSLYAELKRKLDKTIQQNELLQSQVQNMQAQNQQSQPAVQPKSTFQATHVDFGEIIMNELQQKVNNHEISGDDYFAVERFKLKRMQELMREDQAKQGRVQSERQISAARAFNKAKDLGYDLNDRSSLAVNMIWQEIGRRASQIGISAQNYVDSIPTAFEDAMNAISGSLPARKTQSQSRELKQPQPPISDINTARRKTVENEPQPSELDSAFSRRYGTDFKTVNQIRQSVQNPKTFEVTIPMDWD